MCRPWPWPAPHCAVQPQPGAGAAPGPGRNPRPAPGPCRPPRPVQQHGPARPGRLLGPLDQCGLPHRPVWPSIAIPRVHPNAVCSSVKLRARAGVDTARRDDKGPRPEASTRTGGWPTHEHGLPGNSRPTHLVQVRVCLWRVGESGWRRPDDLDAEPYRREARPVRPEVGGAGPKSARSRALERPRRKRVAHHQHPASGPARNRELDQEVPKLKPRCVRGRRRQGHRGGNHQQQVGRASPAAQEGLELAHQRVRSGAPHNQGPVQHPHRTRGTGSRGVRGQHRAGTRAVEPSAAGSFPCQAGNMRCGVGASRVWLGERRRVRCGEVAQAQGRGVGSTGGGLQSSVLRRRGRPLVNTSGDKPRERVLARRPGRDGLARLLRPGRTGASRA